MNQKLVKILFRASFKQVWKQLLFKVKNAKFKNLLKTCFKLVLNQFFSVATFWATFCKKIVIFMSSFLAALVSDFRTAVLLNQNMQQKFPKMFFFVKMQLMQTDSKLNKQL